MNASLSDIIKGNQLANNKRFRKGPKPGGWKNDKFEDVEMDQDDKYFVKVQNLHWNVSETDLQTLFGGKDVVEKVTLKYDKAGRSLGVAELLFKSFSKAKEYRDKFHGETLDGLALQIELLRPFKRTKDNNNSSNVSVFDRLGGNKSKVGKKSGGIADRLGAKKVSILDRLGEKKKSIEERLGKTLDQRLGAVGEVVVPKKKIRNKKNAAGGRTVTSYAEVETDTVPGDVKME